MNKVQEALKAAIKTMELANISCEHFHHEKKHQHLYGEKCIPEDMWKDALELCKAALSAIDKCEPVVVIAIKNVQLQKRIEVLEDLLTSAAAIASRNGEGTHWERFVNALKINGIGNVTAKTFRVLPIDEGYKLPINNEAHEADKEDWAIWKNRALEAEKLVAKYDKRIVDIGVIAMTPITSPISKDLASEDTKRINWLEREIVSVDTFEMDESFGWIFTQYYQGEKEPREIHRSFIEDLRMAIDEAMLSTEPEKV